jgi:uncharacterized SAM-binding protein YcdF (DUF218 family)
MESSNPFIDNNNKDIDNEDYPEDYNSADFNEEAKEANSIIESAHVLVK